MDHFEYVDGRLRAEGVDVAAIAGEVGTPTYVYSAATLRMHYDKLAAAFAPLNPLICYSIKSCSNLAVLKLLVERGAGMDVVSGGELYRARLAGCPGSRIVYAGVGKTDEEIAEALGHGSSEEGRGEAIGLFNIESEGEFHRVGEIAARLGVKAKAALRVNPDVDAKTHAYTTTGTSETKFGVDFRRAVAFFQRFAGHPALSLTGVHLHIGSPVKSTQPYAASIARTLELMDALAKEGHRVETLDIGGGFAADYTTGASLAASDYAAAIVPLLEDRVKRGLKIVLEPGRSICANAGILLTRVLYVKQGGEGGKKKFLICDAGMHTLIRPSLYGAFHFIWPAAVAPQFVPPSRAERPALAGLEECDVVGPICETGDFLAKDRPMPPVAPGDLVAVFAAGAYGMSMSNRYNSHPLPAEVLVEGSRATVVRRRETYRDLVEHELGGEVLESDATRAS